MLLLPPEQLCSFVAAAGLQDITPAIYMRTFYWRYRRTFAFPPPLCCFALCSTCCDYFNFFGFFGRQAGHHLASCFKLLRHLQPICSLQAPQNLKCKTQCLLFLGDLN
jgi:hypothetical protein